MLNKISLLLLIPVFIFAQITETHEFGSTNTQHYMYTNGITWEFYAENNMNVETVEVKSVLASITGTTLHIEVSIGGVVVANWDQYLNDDTYTPYYHTKNVSYQMFQGDKIIYKIFSNSSSLTGGLLGVNYVKLIGSEGTASTQVTLLEEDFDSDPFPPTGWTQTITSADKTWRRSNPTNDELKFSTIDPNSQSSAICPWDENIDSYEWLYTPTISLPSNTSFLEFYSGYSTKWLSEATISCVITTDNGTNWTQIWEAANDGQSWGWRRQNIDLSAYKNQDVRFGWGYVGKNGDLVCLDGVKVTTTLAVDDEEATSNTFRIDQNYPNPFNPATAINYYIPFDSKVKITIYDILGHQVTTIVNENKVMGDHRAIWNGNNNLGQSVSAGTYIYKIQAGEFIQTKKMLLMK